MCVSVLYQKIDASDHQPVVLNLS